MAYRKERCALRRIQSGNSRAAPNELERYSLVSSTSTTLTPTKAANTRKRVANKPNNTTVMNKNLSSPPITGTFSKRSLTDPTQSKNRSISFKGLII